MENPLSGGGEAMPISSADERILSDKELDQLTGVSNTTRWRLRKLGLFPPQIELSPGRRANTLGQIRRWQKERLEAAEGEAKPKLVRRRSGRPRKSPLAADEARRKNPR